MQVLTQFPLGYFGAKFYFHFKVYFQKRFQLHGLTILSTPYKTISDFTLEGGKVFSKHFSPFFLICLNFC